MTTYLGKSCSFGLPRVPFVNCHQFMYLVISLLVLRAGRGINEFLIIAYLFTLKSMDEFDRLTSMNVSYFYSLFQARHFCEFADPSNVCKDSLNVNLK